MSVLFTRAATALEHLASIHDALEYHARELVHVDPSRCAELAGRLALAIAFLRPETPRRPTEMRWQQRVLREKGMCAKLVVEDETHKACILSRPCVVHGEWTDDEPVRPTDQAEPTSTGAESLGHVPPISPTTLRRAANDLIDAISTPAGRDFDHAWEHACLIFGRFGAKPTLLDGQRRERAPAEEAAFRAGWAAVFDSMTSSSSEKPRNADEAWAAHCASATTDEKRGNIEPCETKTETTESASSRRPPPTSGSTPAGSPPTSSIGTSSDSALSHGSDAADSPEYDPEEDIPCKADGCMKAAIDRTGWCAEHPREADSSGNGKGES